MTDSSDDLSRRSFLKATLAGAAIALTKVPAVAETDDHKSQGISPVSGGQTDDLTRMSIREAADLIRAKKVSPGLRSTRHHERGGQSLRLCAGSPGEGILHANWGTARVLLRGT